MIRKVWLARDCFDAAHSDPMKRSKQHVTSSDQETCLLHGQEHLQTRLHPCLPETEEDIRAIRLIRRVWLDVTFDAPPSISLETAVLSPDWKIELSDISCESFDISAEMKRSNDVEELVIAWKAVGFLASVPDAAR
ncbi:hypothetical protein [Celeribacter sp. PS-C1]|uniref:hypothetical protein n=1 Tax=Celeribacter sp. PS-C1 TaxID=2820813 RepID=UPI001CA559D0|nr:hypothetical protein [Celeribacter sp. PS-C1]MBW6418304.1 hypothetical protein [Celeribacter sp. PS-C1]